METLASVVRDFLKSKDFEIQRKGNSLSATITGANGIWRLVVAVNEDDRWLICRSRLPVLVPEGLRRKVALFITYVNYGLILGGYEMDMQDGEVVFKTSLRLPEDEFTPAMAETLIYSNFSTFDRCLPGFLVLVHGRCALRRALELAKEPSHSPPGETPDVPELPPADHPEAEEG